MLVKYESSFKDGAEKGVNKYFEGYSLTSIVEKIQQYTTLENFLIREKSAIQVSASLQFSDVVLVKNPVRGVGNSEAERKVSKLKEILKILERRCQ